MGILTASVYIGRVKSCILLDLAGCRSRWRPFAGVDVKTGFEETSTEMVYQTVDLVLTS